VPLQGSGTSTTPCCGSIVDHVTGDDIDNAIAAFDDQLAQTQAYEPQFLGLSEAEAHVLADRLGLQLRIRHSDDEPLTLDLRASRLTVEVRAGRVEQAHAG
jgi:uncharacterized protein involved in copper resistance